MDRGVLRVGAAGGPPASCR